MTVSSHLIFLGYRSWWWSRIPSRRIQSLCSRHWNEPKPVRVLQCGHQDLPHQSSSKKVCFWLHAGLDNRQSLSYPCQQTDSTDWSFVGGKYKETHGHFFFCMFHNKTRGLTTKQILSFFWFVILLHQKGKTCHTFWKYFFFLIQKYLWDHMVLRIQLRPPAYKLHFVYWDLSPDHGFLFLSLRCVLDLLICFSSLCYWTHVSYLFLYYPPLCSDDNFFL